MAVKRVDIEGVFGSMSQNQRFEMLFGMTPFPYSQDILLGPIMFTKFLNLETSAERNTEETNFIRESIIFDVSCEKVIDFSCQVNQSIELESYTVRT